ncbi:hypothetical protein J6590_088759 [Homalodisca vitripennis]|nr:hypothetical protein J6590_088759 [Homalodisca vitripennis]
MDSLGLKHYRSCTAGGRWRGRVTVWWRHVADRDHGGRGPDGGPGGLCGGGEGELQRRSVTQSVHSHPGGARQALPAGGTGR